MPATATATATLGPGPQSTESHGPGPRNVASPGSVTRDGDLSYARCAEGAMGRGFIRAVEAMTDRGGLIRRTRGWQEDVARGEGFWRVMMRRFGLWLEVERGALEDIPSHGPLIVVANHPYGILDGLVMGHLLAAMRGEFRILAHNVFAGVPALEDVILPLRFDAAPSAVRANIETRAMALRHLQQGGALGVFPGGTVSTAPHPFGRAMDPVWRSFTARLVQRSGATVMPLHFSGSNSRLFQLASHANYGLRMALLLREFATRTDGPVRIALGRPIPAAELARFGSDGRALMMHLRQRTYALAPRPVDATRLGHEFELHHRSPAAPVST